MFGLKGAWVLLLECDYVWMKPMPSPGDAYASDVPGWQYHFGYIMAQHPGMCLLMLRELSLLAGISNKDLPTF